ncbi:ribonuclease P protein component [Alicyclobacillus dauci]|uniref:Ribonuclease P protein component n=1 Tax=Alicyclobacillus dauci TaxID=1475485 RepID=A0ABY6Z2D4_9BACL|nr:ribonuclease P protein component [Alicyclobacillus dauci]WAH37007.1 ribonuclease P protein component [Alicyclobacillus dauci]
MAFFDEFCWFFAEEGDCVLQSEYRLKDNRDFRRVFRRGKSFATGRLVLYYCDNRLGSFRVGFSISKKVGNAVVRNRVKRLLRAVFQSLLPMLVDKHIDIVVVCRKDAALASYDELLRDVMKLLQKAKVVL